VEYTDADSVLRALRVLGSEGSGDDKKIREVVLPALKEGANGKKSIVSNHFLINSSKQHFIHIYIL
jgi:hypothetical protein